MGPIGKLPKAQRWNAVIMRVHVAEMVRTLCEVTLISSRTSEA